MLQFVIPVYNAEKYIEKCINSVLMQNNDNWKMFIINDASTDNTLDNIQQALENVSNDKYQIINNLENKKALYNINNTIRHYCSEDAIIALLDGDDWLAHNNVVNLILNKYQIDENIWMVWTQFIHYPGGKVGKSNKIPQNANIRKAGHYASHLRTFKRDLYCKIKEEDLKDKSGKFFATTYDVAIMLPMLEMAGAKRCRYINNVSYVYNRETPFNDDKLRKVEQQKIARFLRSQKGYKEIK